MDFDAIDKRIDGLLHEELTQDDVTFLIDVVENDEDEMARRTALELLWDVDICLVEDVFLKALRDFDEDVRENACAGLNDSKNIKALEPLKDLAKNDSCQLVRVEAIDALFEIVENIDMDRKIMISFFKECLVYEKVEYVKKHIVSTLEKWGETVDRSIYSLVKFLEELEEAGIYYRMGKIRDEIMVEEVIPGQRWDVEFMTNGSVRIEKFISDGSLFDEQEIDVLFYEWEKAAKNKKEEIENERN